MSTPQERLTVRPQKELKTVLSRNISALVQRRREEEERRPIEGRVVSAISRFVGSMRFVYLHAAFVGLWVAINLGWLPIPPFDPTFVVLATIASVGGIFLSTFVLINQNLMATLADKRADLDLQISLLAEHEVTRLLELVTKIAERMDVQGSHTPELRELTQDVAPEKVLDRMEESEREIADAMENGRRPDPALDTRATRPRDHDAGRGGDSRAPRP